MGERSSKIVSSIVLGNFNNNFNFKKLRGIINEALSRGKDLVSLLKFVVPKTGCKA